MDQRDQDQSWEAPALEGRQRARSSWFGPGRRREAGCVPLDFRRTLMFGRLEGLTWLDFQCWSQNPELWACQARALALSCYRRVHTAGILEGQEEANQGEPTWDSNLWSPASQKSAYGDCHRNSGGDWSDESASQKTSAIPLRFMENSDFEANSNGSHQGGEEPRSLPIHHCASFLLDVMMLHGVDLVLHTSSNASFKYSSKLAAYLFSKIFHNLIKCKKKSSCTLTRHFYSSVSWELR